LTVKSQFTANDGDRVLNLAQWRAVTGQDRHSIASTEIATFVDGEGNHFRLKAGSLAVNRGTVLYAPRVDLAGALRVGGFDIGAYER
jgi:uncharacterized cupin superfamily protein